MAREHVREDAPVSRLRAETRLAALRATGLLDQPPDPKLDRFTRLAARLLGTPVSLLSLVDENRQFFASAFGLAEPWASRRETPLSHSFCQHVVIHEAPLVVEDARQHPVLAANLAIPDLGVVAYAGVPLRSSGGELLGAFCVIDDEPHEWNEEEVDILRDLAEAVITELRLREQAGRAAALLTSLPVVTFDLDVGSGNLLALDGAVKELLGGEVDELLHDRSRWEALVDPADRAAVMASRTSMREGEPRTIAYRLRPRTGSWLWVQETLSRNPAIHGASGTIHGAIIDVTPQHQLAQRLEAQNRVALALSSAADVEEAAEDVLRHLGESLGWEVGNFWLPTDSRGALRCLAQWWTPDRPPSKFTADSRRRRFRRGEGLPGRCWERADAVWARDVLQESNFPRHDAAASDDLHAAVAFPILGGDEVAGVIEFFSREMRDPDSGLLEVTRAIGRQIGQFLDRVTSEQALRASRAYYRRVARTFQRSLMPAEPPAVEGFSIATRFHPASEGSIVGGDFFDIFRLPSGHWAISIGDVCGKGTEAAAVTSLVRHALRGAALTGASPAAALEIANQALLNEELQERFCSAIFVELWPRNGGEANEIVLANAGHPGAFVLRRDAAVELIGRHAIVLGAFPSLQATPEKVRLRPGDALVLYTDGYTEARGADGDFGEERLAAVLRSCAGGSAHLIASTLDEAVEKYARGRRRDDQALVVLQAVRSEDLS